jgi:hypothetical protein
MPRTLILIRGQRRRPISLRPSLDLRDILPLSACTGVKNGQEKYHAYDTTGADVCAGFRIQNRCRLVLASTAVPCSEVPRSPAH